MLTSLILTLSTLLLAWLSFGAFYQFIGAIAGLFFKNDQTDSQEANQGTPTIRVFIPAYREDVVIINTVRRVLESEYPANCFEALVIADGLRAETVNKLRTLGANVQEVSFEKSTKAKALNAALQANACNRFDIAVVLDADNAPATDFLKRVATQITNGTKALQGRRASKASTSPMALLDAASEDANNHILCRGARALGFSARLAGSGMAFEYNTFESTMANIDAVGGFDKALEGSLTQQGISIEYDEKAIVFDEKVSNSAAFTTQRGRWIAAQFRYCRLFLPAATVALFQAGNIDFFHKALQMALPPRLLAPGILAFGALVSLLLDSPLVMFWAVALVANVAAFAIALPSWIFKKEHLNIWLHLPKVFFTSILALLKVPQANKVFIVTPKTLVV